MSEKIPQPADDNRSAPADDAGVPVVPATDKPEQPPRPDPTRYGDWEKNGRCIDF